MPRRHSVAALLLSVILITVSFMAARPPLAHAQTAEYKVDNTGDADTADACTETPDDCSLRQAIQKANSDSGPSKITFAIPTSDPGYSGMIYTIKPGTSLPSLSEGATTIQGPGNAGVPVIVLDGSSVAPSNAVGFTITSANNVIQQLAIIGFHGNSTTAGIGIRITGVSATNNTIIGNYIGIRYGQTAASNDTANGQAGIQIDTDASGNKIGLEDNPASRNVISGNGSSTDNDGNGILLLGVSGNTIQGNYIGVVPGIAPLDPILAVPNHGYGIQISGSHHNTVGGTSGTQRNIISGNLQDGVLITGLGSDSNTITGNYIGTNQVGDIGIPNGANGVQINNQAKNNVISGSSSSPSIISGNANYGVLITDSGTSGNRVYGNFIGVNDSGSGAVPNTKGGVRIQNNASNNIIGTASSGNTISGNGNQANASYGVSLGGGTNIFSNTITGNFIGLNATGTAAVANTGGGILIDEGSTYTRVGGPGSERNVISGNGGPGIVINGPSATNTVVSGNLIGLRRGGPKPTDPFILAAPNIGDGVRVTRAQKTRIGGPNALDGNTIAATQGHGIHISGTQPGLTSVQFNLIGTAKNGNAYVGGLGNTGHGVLVDEGAQPVTIVDNAISGNGGKGIHLEGTTIGGGVETSPNHDIDPPGFSAMRLNQSRVLVGKVLVTPNTPSACIKCTIQIFSAEADGQGRDKVGETKEVAPDGSFSTKLSAALPAIPPLLALTATDEKGNTSEFITFTAKLALSIEPAQSGQAAPSETISYLHQVSNPGTVDLNDLRLTVKPQHPDWKATVTPTQLSLNAGATAVVTVNVTLPPGANAQGTPNKNALPGVTDTTIITVTSTNNPSATDAVSDTTTVLEKFVLAISPPTGKGSGVPSRPGAPTVVSYPHKLTNNGNTPGTVSIGVTSTVGGKPAPQWTTTVTPTDVTLSPGQSIDLRASVVIPQDAQRNTQCQTVVTLASVGTQILVTDTTTVRLAQQATMVFDQTGDAGAGERIRFQHTVTNLSNGRARFKLFGSSSLGSIISFSSNTPGIALNADNSFELDIAPGKNVFNFAAEIIVSDRAIAGQKDLVAIGLYDEGGGVVGGASVSDTINIVRGGGRKFLAIIKK